MPARLRVLFLGNHTVGVRTLTALNRRAHVVGVVAHPPDPEDGSRYESVFDVANAMGIEQVIRSTPRQPELAELVRLSQPELIWTTDYRYLLPMTLVDQAPLGGINLHPSLLPQYRGRASINWAILHGRRTFGLTAHWIDSGADTGDIALQRSYRLHDAEDVGDALRKLYPLYEELATEAIERLRLGELPRIPQDERLATSFPRRTPEDGAIDWSQPARAIHNLIRAVARPYPGAFTQLGERLVHCWKSRVLDEHRAGEPGSVIAAAGDWFCVMTGCGVLEISEATIGEQSFRATIGDHFQSAQPPTAIAPTTLLSALKAANPRAAGPAPNRAARDAGVQP